MLALSVPPLHIAAQTIKKEVPMKQSAFFYVSIFVAGSYACTASAQQESQAMLVSPILSLLSVVNGQEAVSGGEGSATGTLTVNGKTFTLSHVRAEEIPDPFDDSKKQIRVVLSDVAVSDVAMHNRDSCEDLILDNKLHTIEFTFTAEGETAGGELYDDMKSHGFTHGSFNFEKKVFDSKTVSGKVSTQPVSKSSEMQFKCTATFSATVER